MSRFREKVKGDSKFRALATTSISNNNKMIATSNHESSIVPFSYKRVSLIQHIVIFCQSCLF